MRVVVAVLLAATAAPGPAHSPPDIRRVAPWPCVVSWYDGDGQRGAGGYLAPGGLYAASRSLPFGQRVAVSRDGHDVVVVVADRGPYVDGRDLDLSPAAFRRLAPVELGVVSARCVTSTGVRP